MSKAKARVLVLTCHRIKHGRCNIKILSDPHFSKESFRVACKAIWRAQRAWDIKDHRIVTHLKQVLRQLKPRYILIYCPMPKEANIKPLITWARPKVRLFVPVIQGNSFSIAPYRLPLQKNAHQILEPRLSHLANKTLDVAIVPILGVDGAFKRVGFGKGMFDRFFAKLESLPFTIFISRQLIYTPVHLGESHDIRAHLCIDQQGNLYNPTMKKMKRKPYARCFFKHAFSVRPHRH